MEIFLLQNQVFRPWYLCWALFIPSALFPPRPSHRAKMKKFRIHGGSKSSTMRKGELWSHHRQGFKWWSFWRRKKIPLLKENDRVWKEQLWMKTRKAALSLPGNKTNSKRSAGSEEWWILCEKGAGKHQNAPCWGKILQVEGHLQFMIYNLYFITIQLRKSWSLLLQLSCNNFEG